MYNRRFLPLALALVALVFGASLVPVHVPAAQALPGAVPSPRLWLRADSQVTFNATTSAVTKWTDVSGATDITTQATTTAQGGVTFATSVFNFNPAVRFAGGTSQEMRGTSSTTWPLSTTIFVVEKAQPKAEAIQGLISSDTWGITRIGGTENVVMDGGAAHSPNSANTVDIPAAGVALLRGTYAEIATTSQTTKDSTLAVAGRLNENYTAAGATVVPAKGFEVGGRTLGGFTTRTFDGDIAEIIVYPSVLSAAEFNRVESYLAIKYGITLNGPVAQGTSADYTTSSSVVTWSGVANPRFHNDVAGVGADGTDLDQRVSSSVNDGLQVTIANGAFDFSGTINAQSPSAVPQNGSFLVWGHDAGSVVIDRSMFGVVAAAQGVDTRMERIWRTQVTNPAGLDAQTSIRVPAAMIDQASGITNPSLLISSDPNFSDITRSVALTKDGDFYEATFPRFAAGDFFTFGSRSPVPVTGSVCSVPPTAGSATISGVVNTYYEGLTATVTAGTASPVITRGTARGAADALAVGDVVLIAQMQGATINATNTNNYGAGNASGAGYVSLGRSAGDYEYAQVTAVTATTVTLTGAGSNGGLVNSYTKLAASATRGVSSYQIVRIPPLHDVTIGGTVTSAAWDGKTGGIVAIDAANTINFNGQSISVTGQGFRGGAGRASASSTNTATDFVVGNTANPLASQKGEGIVGTPSFAMTTTAGYPSGDYARGAPGNAGGGADVDGIEAGGGGGGGFASAGTGGMTNSTSAENRVGGLGGVGIGDADLMTLGGGGGAGHSNGTGVPTGGVGGGIVIVRAASASGTGIITASGSAGTTTTTDAGGGGGGGGRVVVLTSSGSLAGLAITAAGGAGGGATDSSGPGGGGGGGLILASSAVSAVSAVTGGAAGPLNGADRDPQPGFAGVINTTRSVNSLAGLSSGACADLVVTKTVGGAATATGVPGTMATYTVTVTNRGPFPATGNAPFRFFDTVPVLTTVTWSCSATAGSTCGSAAGIGSTIDTTANLAANGVATYLISGMIPPAQRGTISNSAAVDGGSSGVLLQNTTDDTATATITLTPQADLAVTKTDGTTSAAPGAPVTYTMAVTNNGPSSVSNARVTDTLPTGAVSGTWTCTADAGAVCDQASGTFPLDTTVDFAGGSPVGRVVFEATLAINTTATGSLANTVTVDTNGSAVDPNSANNSATDTDTLDPRSDVSVTKTDGVETTAAGSAFEYTIVVAGAGPSPVAGVAVVDDMPAALQGVSWTCSAPAGSSCAVASGSGSIATTVNLGVGGTATFVVRGTIASDFRGTLSNQARVTLPVGASDPVLTNNSATDETLVTGEVDLGITKTDSLLTVSAGSPQSYTIVVSNSGPSTARNAVVTDTLPSTITAASWTCAASAGSSCGDASGSNSIASTVTLLPGGSATYTLSGTIDPAASGMLRNTASVAAATGDVESAAANNTATDSSTISRSADLAVTKSDGVSQVTPGTQTSYIVRVRNVGPASAVDATVTDPVPSGIESMSWTCVADAGASCAASGTGAINDSTVDLPPGGGVTYTVVAQVAASASGSISNVVTVGSGSTEADPQSANNTATDTDSVIATADLRVTKTDGQTSVTTGQSVTYTIVASNAGPSAVSGATVSDSVPAALTGVQWTCTSTGAAVCTASGSGSISDLVNMPSGSTVTYTVTGVLAASAGESLANTATVTVPADVVDPNLGNNSATDTDSVIRAVDLRVTKSDGVTDVQGGSTVEYEIVIRNTGSALATGARVTDPLPSTLSNGSWSCAASAGSACANATGSGSIDELVTVAPGGTVTFTMTATVNNVEGDVPNVVTVEAPPGFVEGDSANNVAVDTDSITPVTDLQISKTDGQSTLIAGNTVSYTVIVNNIGQFSVTGATVADTVPAGLTGASWVCVATGGAQCQASGAGSINELVDLPVGGRLTFTVSATVAADATGSIANTATVATPSGVTDSTPGNNSATDTDTVLVRPNLGITKTDGVTVAVPGGQVTYTIVASNAGPSSVLGASITDALPATLSGASWSCAAATGARCSESSGAGSIATTADLPVGSSVTYTVTATVSPGARGTLSNTAVIAAPAGTSDLLADNNTAVDTDTLTPRVDLEITKGNGLSGVIAGTNVTYTVLVTNRGPSTVQQARVVDVLPADLMSATWSCVTSSGAANSCSASSGTGGIDTTVDLDPAATATFTITARVDPNSDGPVVNTATVAVPLGTTETQSSSNSATDTDPINDVADLSISKTDGVSDAVPGQQISYTITVANAGPSTAVSANVTDVLPASLVNASWRCQVVATASCASETGTGSIDTTVSLEPGGSVTITLTATVAAAATGTLSNTARVAAPAGTSDPVADNNAATDTDTLTARADIAVTKTLTTGAVAGSAVSYDILVSNQGPSDDPVVLVEDTPPSSITGVSWTCTATAPSSCAQAAGVGPLSSNAAITAGSSVRYVLTGTLSAAATGSLLNTATTTASVTDPNPGNNSASSTATIGQSSDLAITKTDNASTVVAGAATVYTVQVSNRGPSAVIGARVVDALPDSLMNASWSCSAVAPSSCATATGTGSLDSLVDLVVNGSVTFTITATVRPGATDALSNTATIAAPSGVTETVPGNNSATDTTAISRSADVAVTKTQDTATIVAGQPVQYTIVASNSGPSTAFGTAVVDSIPGAITNVSWSCSATAPSQCGAPSGSGTLDTTADLVPGAGVTYVLTGTVSAQATGDLSNSVTVTVATGTTDPVTTNNTATTASAGIGSIADLTLLKTIATNPVVAGQSVAFVIQVANTGPSAVTGAMVTDTLPDSLRNASWTCSATLPNVCGRASGTGSIVTLVDLVPGGTATYSIVATVDPAATGTLSNTASIAPPATTTDPELNNNTLSVATRMERHAALSVTKTDGRTTAFAGTGTNYTIEVSNSGPSTAPGVRLTDTIPATLLNVSWDCSATPGSTCAQASGSGSMIDILMDLAPGGRVTVRVTATIDPAVQRATITNVAEITVPDGLIDTNAADNSATDTTTVTANADLSITKTDSSESAVPGSPVSYTIVVSNAGPSSVVGATVRDPLPPELTGVTWQSTAVAPNSSSADSGVGVIEVTVDLVPGGSVSFTVTGTVVANARGDLINTATVTAPADIVDPDESNNTATDTDALRPTVDLSVTKTNAVSSVVAGEEITYTIVVSNAGPSQVAAVAVTDTMPSALGNVSWTCAAVDPNSCAASSGTGSIDSTVDLAANGSATYTVRARVSAKATGTLENRVTVTAPTGVAEAVTTNNTASDSDPITLRADLSIAKTDNATTSVPGAPVSYTITVSNAGPSNATGTVTDVLPTVITGVAWTCAVTGDAVCAEASGTGAVDAGVTIAPGATVVFTVTGTLDENALGILSNTATITPASGVADSVSSNNSATDSNSITPRVDLAVNKSGNLTEAQIDAQIDYTITVTNTGPSVATGARLSDPVVPELRDVSWQCQASAGASCPAASGTGAIDALIDVGVGATVTFTVQGTVATQQGTVANAATVVAGAGTQDTDSANNSDSHLTTVSRVADLSVTKTDGLTTAIAGRPLTYTIVVRSAGPSEISNARMLDAGPPSSQFTNVTWSCQASAGSSCVASGTGAIDSLFTIASGGEVTYTMVGTVDPAATGILVNSATVTLPDGQVDPTPTNNTARDETTVSSMSDLAVTKTDARDNAVPGMPTSYQIVVTNTGPSVASQAVVRDSIPAALMDASWTCSVTGGGSCGVAGDNGAIDTTVDNLAPGARATLTITGTIDPTARGSIVNTALVIPAPEAHDSDPQNNAGTDTSLLRPETDLSITNTDGRATAVPGTVVSYTVTVSNTGPSTALAAQVSNPLPPGATEMSWSCVASPGSRCDAAPMATTGSGALVSTPLVVPGGTVTYTVLVTIDPAASGSITSSATVSAEVGATDPDPANNVANDTDVFEPTGTLTITKTRQTDIVVAGSPVRYLIEVSNAGPSTATGARILDTLSDSLTDARWTCSGTAGAGCSAASGTGDVSVDVTIPPGATVSIIVDARVRSGVTGTLQNSATVIPPTTFSDPTPRTTPPDSTPVAVVADLSVTKSNQVSELAQGSLLDYQVVVSNAGPSLAAAMVSDPIPTGLNGFSWSCSATGEASCSASAGAGGLEAILVSIPVGDTVIFSVRATVTAASGSVYNTASVALDNGTDPDLTGNAATDLDLMLSVPTPAPAPLQTPTGGLAATGFVSSIPFWVVLILLAGVVLYGKSRRRGTGKHSLGA